MPQFIVWSTDDQWTAYSNAAAGYRQELNMTPGVCSGGRYIQCDYEELAVGQEPPNDYFQFKGNMLQTSSMPETANIIRYRIYWRQASATVDPCDISDYNNIWTRWTSAFRFGFGPDSLVDPGDGLPAYNITYGFNNGDYYTDDPYFTKVGCFDYGLNCLIDSYVFDPDLERFVDADPNKSLNSPVFWNNYNENLVASFSMPIEYVGLSLSNNIGKPCGSCCSKTLSGGIPFAFVVDYSDAGESNPNKRRRYYLSFIQAVSDVTKEATTTLATTTSTSTTTLTSTTTSTTSTTTTSTTTTSTTTTTTTSTTTTPPTTTTTTTTTLDTSTQQSEQGP